MNAYNTDERPYQFHPPEDRNKAERMWSTNIEILGMKAEELTIAEFRLQNYNNYGGKDSTRHEMEKNIAKLRAEVLYLQESNLFLAAFLTWPRYSGWRDEKDAS